MKRLQANKYYIININAGLVYGYRVLMNLGSYFKPRLIFPYIIMNMETFYLITTADGGRHILVDAKAALLWALELDNLGLKPFVFHKFENTDDLKAVLHSLHYLHTSEILPATTDDLS